jgi:hypothetical protein
MICGNKATPNSGHWTKQQGCPRWGELDAANSIFDDPVPGELGIVVGMAMLPPTDPHIPVVASLSNGNGARSDEQTLREVREDFDLEILGLQWAAGGNHTVLNLISDMRELLQDLACNLEWAVSEWDLRDPVIPLFRLARLLNPVHEAVQSVNFIIRHEGFILDFSRRFVRMLILQRRPLRWC